MKNQRTPEDRIKMCEMEIDELKLTVNHLEQIVRKHISYHERTEKVELSNRQFLQRMESDF